MSEVKHKFISLIEEKFTNLRGKLNPLISDQLLSPFKIEVPHWVRKDAQNVIQNFYQLRNSCSYRDGLKSPFPDPKNKSILMSYDFHLTNDGQLKLIEINTNASFLALSSFMYEAHGLKGFDFNVLKNDILNELMLFGKNITNPKILIVDEKPLEQKLYAEFLVYNELFQSWGWSSTIEDIENTSDRFDFIYNRSTDFYFEDSKSSKLKEIFLNRKACVSPNPYEYFLLADKLRLIEISNQKKIDLKEIADCKILNSESAEEIWINRKNYFLKPLRSYGGKQSYKAASISKKIFEQLTQQEVIAQEYVPAGEKVFSTPQGNITFKYDLRFYAYQDQLEFAVARLYQGQVTNLKTPLGGFAPVIFTA